MSDIPPHSKLALPLLQRLQTKQLGVAWALAVLVGALVISKSGTTTARHLVWPVIILISYALFAVNRWSALFGEATEAFKQSIVAQIADSIYFMGFLWTLWALIDSFVLRSRLDTSEEMFRAFGYALVTTAVGMFGRLAILQFKYTAVDQSQEAQESVEQLLRKFAQTLNETEVTLDDWRTGLHTGTNAIDECNKELQKVLTGIGTETDESVKLAIESLREGLKNAVFRIEAVIKTLGEQLQMSIKQGVAEGLSDLGTTTTELLKEMREETSSLLSAIKKGSLDVTKSNTTVGGNFERMNHTLEAATARLETVAGTLSCTMGTAGERVEAAADRFDSELASIPNIVRADCRQASALLTEIAEDVKKDVFDKLGSIDPSALTADRISESMVRAIKPATEILDAIGANVKGIQDIVGPSRDGERGSLMSELHDRLPATMSAGVAKIHSRLESIEGQISTAIKQRQSVNKRWIWPWDGR